jgi:hypothetical protein
MDIQYFIAANADNIEWVKGFENMHQLLTEHQFATLVQQVTSISKVGDLLL